MSRRFALSALALLVAVAIAVGSAGALGGGSPSPGESVAAVDGTLPQVVAVSNTTNYLSPGGDTTRGYARSDVDVVAAAGMSATRLHARHDNLTFENRFESVPEADSDRMSLIRERTDRIAAELERLNVRHDALLSGYENGTISRETFLRRLARLYVSVNTVEGKLQYTADRAEATPGLSLPTGLEARFSTLRSGLLTLPNPVVEGRVTPALTGRRDPAVVYVSAGDEGLVLATVFGDEFVRTATLPGEFAPDEPDQFEQSEGRATLNAFERGGQLYPWAYDNAVNTPQIGGSTPPIYRIYIEHTQGTLESYLSGGSTNAFHEVQTKRTGDVPTTGRATNATDSLNVTVDTTNPSGPMRVTLIQQSTGAPLNGTVLVDGQPVGTTGTDGELYTVQPDGRFRVNATTGANTVAVNVSG